MAEGKRNVSRKQFFSQRSFSLNEVVLTELTLVPHHSHLLDHLLLLGLDDGRGVLRQLAEESRRLRGVGRRAGAHAAEKGGDIVRSAKRLKSLSDRWPFRETKVRKRFYPCSACSVG